MMRMIRILHCAWKARARDCFCSFWERPKRDAPIDARAARRDHGTFLNGSDGWNGGTETAWKARARGEP